MVATVEQLAELVRGRLVGDGSVPIRSARPVGEAGPGDITFIENERYAKLLRAFAGLRRDRRPALQTRRPRTPELAVIEVDDPIAAFLAVRSHLDGEASLDGRASILKRMWPRRPGRREWRSTRSPTSATTP